MEYAVSVSASLSDQPGSEVTLTASEFDDGRLDWSSFDVNLESALGSKGDHTFTAVTETTVPAPVLMRSMYDQIAAKWDKLGLADLGAPPHLLAFQEDMKSAMYTELADLHQKNGAPSDAPSMG